MRVNSGTHDEDAIVVAGRRRLTVSGSAGHLAGRGFSLAKVWFSLAKV